MVKKKSKLVRISPVLDDEIKMIGSKEGISFVEASRDIGKIIMKMRIKKFKIKRRLNSNE